MKRWLFPIIFVLALGCAIAWRLESKISSNRNLAQQAQLRKTSASNVVVAIAKSGEIEQHLSVVGSLETPYDMKLAPKVAGVIEYLQARPGDRVNANEVLARVNPVEQEQQVAQEQSVLAEDQQKYTQALITQAPTNQQVYTNIGENQAALAQAQANENQVVQNSQAQIAASRASVTDFEGKVASAQSQEGAASQAVNSAQANYNDAAAKYSREYKLYQEGFVAAQDTDDALAAEKVQEAAVASAQQSLQAAASAVNSANAELKSAKEQLSITIKQQEANIVAAKAATKTAKEALNYSTTNRAAIPAYQANLRALKATVDADRALLGNYEQQVKDTALTVPFPGTVTSRLMDNGSMAGAGQEILEVQYLDWLYVACSAPVDYINQVKPRMTASLTFDALPGQTFTAPVVKVTPAADPTSRQFTFLVKLNNPEGVFKPSMFGNADIIVGHKHVDVMVPREAVENGDAGPNVAVVGPNNVVHMVNVNIGASDAKNIEITGPVKAGDQVVILTYRSVKDGQKVTVNESLFGSGHSGNGSRSSPKGGQDAASSNGT